MICDNVPTLALKVDRFVVSARFLIPASLNVAVPRSPCFPWLRAGRKGNLNGGENIRGGSGQAVDRGGEAEAISSLSSRSGRYTHRHNRVI